MSISSLNDYKKAKVISKDLTYLASLVKANIQVFEEYKKYVPVQEILSTLKENYLIIKLHLDKQIKIIENKGTIE